MVTHAPGQYWLTAGGDLVKLVLVSDVAIAGHFVEFGEHSIVHFRPDGTHHAKQFNLAEYVRDAQIQQEQ